MNISAGPLHRHLLPITVSLLLLATGCDDAPQADGDDPESAASELSGDKPFGDDAFVLIEAGSFTMGAEEDDEDAHSIERPSHEVTLTRDFYLQTHPVTQQDLAQFDIDVESAYEPCAQCPADNTLWLHAVLFANAVSEAQGLEPCYDMAGAVIDGDSVYECTGYRLPTEAEWEYAYRAGTSSPFYWGDDNTPRHVENYAWYIWNAGGHSQPVGHLEPNPWGLYEMAGNVAEWTHDSVRTYDGDAITDPGGDVEARLEENKRVLRGGSIALHTTALRASHRHISEPTEANSGSVPSGFRLARTADP